MVVLGAAQAAMIGIVLEDHAVGEQPEDPRGEAQEKAGALLLHGVGGKTGVLVEGDHVVVAGHHQDAAAPLPGLGRRHPG